MCMCAMLTLEAPCMRAGHANQDGEAVARDQLYIIRDTKACPNRLGAIAAAPPPVAASIGANPLQGWAG